MIKVDYGFIDSVLEQNNYDKSSSIAIMQAIQGEYRYLPEEALRYVADKLGISASALYGVATFYENFSLTEKGMYIIRVCDGTACHVKKSADIQQALLDAIGMTAEDNMSADGLFTIERVACLGACGLAPVCTVNGVVYAQMTPKKARELIAELREAEKDED